MAAKTVSFNTHCNLCDTHLEVIARWMSCNGEVWGVGPTVVFASAAALFLYNELQTTIFVGGDHAHVSLMEKTLVSTMVIGMLALMIHLWVCTMRFFQYYLDTLIRDSPSMLLEMTTAGLLGGQGEIAALGPLTRFLRQQQPQIHITVCWFLSLCYADYVRKHYCQRYNMPYLDQWQQELHERAASAARRTMRQVNSFVGHLHQRLRGFVPMPTQGQTLRRDHTCPPSRDANEAPDVDTPTKELCVRLVSQSSETTADAIEKLRAYISLIEWSKCGDSYVSLVPTALWAVGAAALARRLIFAIFRRFLFRRVPWWETILQHLLFVWMVIYSMHFWMVLVRAAKATVAFCYEEDDMIVGAEDLEGRKTMQQWVVWMCGAVPLAYYIHTRPRPETPPLMIWITTNPWLRREMGAYGYYLNRPLPTLQSSTDLSPRQQALTMRRAFSDSKIILKPPVKKKRNSKSV